jgi:purine-nucleoside phosphorylase
MAKRTHSIRLQNSDVFYAPKSLGLKAARQNSIMFADMELNGLHPQSCLFAQSIIGLETIAFTTWVSAILNENGKYPVRSCWSESVRNLERMISERNE